MDDVSTLYRVVETAHSPLLLTDPNQFDNPIVYANEALEQLTGYSRTEILGRNCRFLQGDGTDPEKVAKLRQGIDNEEPTCVVLRNYRKDGTEFWNKVRVAPVHDDGSLVRFLGTQTDVSELVERNRELEQARAEYQGLIDAMNDIAWVVDPDGSIRAVNDAMVELVGRSRAELLSMDLEALVPTADRPELRGYLRRIENERVHGFEAPVEATDGDRIPTEFSIIPVSFRGEHAILGIGRDVTQRKRREERLEEFTSIVSHDLRSPLAVARGSIELAAEEHESDHLDRAHRAIDRMDELIDDLLTLARGGDRIGAVEPVELAELTRECWEHVETGSASLEIVDSVTITADRTRCGQLLENLFRNAIEHGGSSGTVSVGSSHDEFYVADDGPGIPAADRDAIFKSGFSTSSEGTGIGLQIVTEIVTGHGWRIAATDSEHGGARFEITGVELTSE